MQLFEILWIIRWRCPIKSVTDEIVFFRQLMKMLAMEFGDHCEVVLHDLVKDYSHTIIEIVNNHVTGRQIGDCGSNLGLEVLRGSVKDGDRHSYVTYTRDGKTLRSSTVYIKDDEGMVIGALCVNFDISELLKFEGFLKKFNQYEIPEDSQEVFVNNVTQLLDFLIQDAEKHVGKSPENMTKEDKMQFLKFLDQKGAFMITKSGEKVWKYLGISKFTFYSYLEEIRGDVKSKEEYPAST